MIFFRSKKGADVPVDAAEAAVPADSADTSGTQYPPYEFVSAHKGKSREQERRQRYYQMFAAVILLLVVLVGTWVQLELFGVDSWLFFVLLNVNSVLMLAMLFLVGRNVVKLALERRRNVFGARLRTKFVIAFMSLSLIPTLIMFLASNRVVGTSLDYWFTTQVENSMQLALEVGQSFYAAAAERLRTRSDAMLAEIKARNYVWGGTGMAAFMQRKQKEYDISLVGIVNAQHKEQNWSADPAFQRVWNEARNRIDWEHVERNTFGSVLWAGESGDYVIGVLAIDGGKTGFLLTAENVGHGLMFKLQKIVQGFEEYSYLKQQKKPLKVSFVLILGLLSLVIVFGALWFGFRLSKELTAPILALAEGTNRLAKGDLHFRLHDRSNDELGLLVHSFNHMAADLEESQARLQQAYQALAEKNEAIAAHNHYVEAVLDNVAAGVVTMNSTGRILTLNKAACTLFKASPETMMGNIVGSFLPPEQREVFQEMLDSLRARPQASWHGQMDLLIDQKLRKLMITTVAVNTGSGAVYIAVLEDITELEKMQRMAAWREVARRIAHEIKNPLTPIKLSAQRLERKFGTQVSDPAFSQCTDVIVRQVERMQLMVSEFSSFAKMPEIQLAPVRLIPIIEEVVTFFRNSHSRIDWVLDIHVDPDEMRLDSAALHRAFINILTNAAEALEQNSSPHVCITVALNESIRMIQISIADNGVGLDTEEYSRMFEPYFSRKSGGTGLGLAIVKSTFTDHHGKISALPNPGGGTVICIDLPI